MRTISAPNEVKMPKRQDPIIAIMQYFETASPEQAQQALSVAKAILKRRFSQPTPKPKKKAPAISSEADRPLPLTQ